VGSRTASATEPSSTAAGSTLRSLVDTNGAAIEPGSVSGDRIRNAIARPDSLDVVHRGDRGIGGRILGEAHESETATASGISVLDDDLCACERVGECGVNLILHSQPRQPDRTPRTSGAGSGRRYAMPGRC